MPAHRTPVVFIHGLWLHADSWTPWLTYFRDAGYTSLAPGWPGEAATVAEARAHPQQVAGYGVDDVVAHYRQTISTLGTKPIVVGHSFGGLIAQKLLGQGQAVAAIAIDAAPIKGVLTLPFAALRSASPVLRNPADRRRAISLTPDQFRYAFGNALPREESDALHELWAVAAPGKPLFEAAFANLSSSRATKVDTRNADRGPLLLIAGGNDHTVPASITKATRKQYRSSGAITDFNEFPDRGHSLVIDSRWSEVADYAAKWLAGQGLA